jgi:ABC-2 type transport system ATP-binding protein
VILRAEELTRDYSTGFLRRGRHRALDHVSFDLAKGEVFGLLGPNGAGKSTTLKLLTGLLAPTSGRVWINGLDPRQPSARARLGFLPDQPHFYQHLTGRELLLYFAGLCGVSPRDQTTRVEGLLADVGLAPDANRLIREYSKGMVQRLGLAQALVNDPDVLLLDEPMSGLDPAGRRDVRALILDWRDRGRTVLFSSHILTDAEQLCSRVAILHRGRVVAQGAVSTLTEGRRRGWEVEASDLTPAAVASLESPLHHARRIAHGRYSFELGSGTLPEAFVARVAAAGGRLERVTPTRASLEDVFLEHVS